MPNIYNTVQYGVPALQNGKIKPCVGNGVEPKCKIQTASFLHLEKQNCILFSTV